MSETQPADAKPRPSGSCLAVLVLMFRYFGMPVDAGQIAHECGTQALTADDLLRVAKRRELKARQIASNWERLAHTALPAIAWRADGSFFILARVTNDQVLIHDPSAGKPETLNKQEFLNMWAGQLILLAKRATLTDIARRFDVTWFLGALHKYRKLFVEVVLASFFLQIFALVSPLFFQVVVDKVLVHRSLATLDVLVIGLVIVSMFETVLGALRTYLFSHTTSRVDVELGARLFRQLISLPLAYFEARRTGDSVARIRELENIRNFLTSSALTLAIDLVFTIVFLAVMAVYSLPLTFIVAVSLPFYVLVSVLLTPVFKKRLDEKFNRGAENQAFLVENVHNIETLKSLAVEPQMQRMWEDQLAGYVKASFNVISLSNWGSQAVQLVGKLASAAILFFGAHAVMEGKLTVGELVAFNMLASRVAQPVLRLAQLWQDFQQTRISIDRLGDILNTPIEPISSSRTALPAIKGAITFDRVSFRYRPDAPVVLEDIHLEIPAGQMVGIVGSSGSGKSTLTKLVQRFYTPERGRLLIDGKDVAMVDAAWLRRQVGVVLQENTLFSRTIRGNIALADPGMPIEQVMAVAKLAGAHEFIMDLPKGYDTEIGERGVGLSGGQRQRIAIARALVTNPQLLIFDEATSALDYESEQVVQRNLKLMARGRTVLIIAHRLSAVRQCDRILTLEKGRIIEDGTPENLAKAGGRFATLLKLQGASHAA